MPRTKKAAAPKPLTAAHRTLLATCLHLGTDDSRALATHLHLSVETVSTYFQRIHKRLGTVTRTEAILRYARETGLLLPSPATSDASDTSAAGKPET